MIPLAALLAALFSERHHSVAARPGSGDPLLEALVQLGVDRVVDTHADPDFWRTVAIPGPEPGTMLAWHVTSDPSVLFEVLGSGGNLALTRRPGRWGELGRGLYASAVPKFWVGRAIDKWSFLHVLQPGPELTRLCVRLVSDVYQLPRSYLTSWELKRAVDTLFGVQDGTRSPGELLMLANQPYNLAFWKPSYLRPLGIEPGGQPQVVELVLQGRFAELPGRGISEQAEGQLRAAGLSGAFTRMGFSANPQVVIWDKAAVKSARLVDWTFGRAT